MENRVGDELPTEDEAAKLVKEVEGLMKKVGKYGGDLSPEERRHALKPPDGSEEVTELIARLVDKHKVSIPGVNAADMLADLTLARRLAPLARALASLERRVEDVILQANAERWSATTSAYTSLVRAMGASPELENDLKPATTFFGVGRKRKPRSPSPT